MTTYNAWEVKKCADSSCNWSAASSVTLPSTIITNEASLLITANTLDTGFYYIARLTTTPPSTVSGGAQTQDITMFTMASVFEVNLLEGVGFVSTEGQAVTLTPDIIDPDSAWKAYEWLATNSNGTTLYHTETTLSSGVNQTETGVLTVGPSILPASGSPYTFTLNVTRVAGTVTEVKSVSTVVEISANAVPVISVTKSYDTTAMSAEDYLGISVAATVNGAQCGSSTQSCTYAWTSTPSGTMLAVDLSSSANVLSSSLTSTGLTLNRNILTPGSTYAFKISVSYTSSGVPTTGYTIVSVLVNEAPSGGALAVAGGTNLTGTYLNEEFTATASLFSDSNTPLSYAFGYFLRNDDGSYPTTPSFTTAYGFGVSSTFSSLPIGALQMVVYCKDSIGAVASLRSNDTVTINSLAVPADSTLSQVLESQTDSLLAAATGAAKTALLGSLAGSLSADSSSDAAAAAAATSVREKLASSFLSSTNGTIDDSQVAGLAAAAAAIAGNVNQLSAAAQTALASAMTSMMSSDSPVDADTATSFLTTLSNVNSASSNTSTADSNAAAEQFAANMGNLGKKLLGNAVTGAPATEISSGTSTTSVQQNTQEDAISATVGGVGVKSFTSTSRRTSSSCNAIVAGAVKQAVSSYVGSYAGAVNSKITSANVYQDVSGVAQKACMSDLSQPAAITMKQLNSASFDSTSACSYWNTANDAWATAGVTTSFTSVTSLVCSTTHFTEFSAITPTSTTTTTPTPTPTPTPTSNSTADSSAVTETISQLITFSTVTSTDLTEAQLTAYKTGYRDHIGTGSSACTTCACSITYSANRRSTNMNFAATATAALATAALATANALVGNAANLNALATAINNAAAGVAGWTNLAGSSMVAQAATSASISGSGDDGLATWVIVIAVIAPIAAIVVTIGIVMLMKKEDQMVEPKHDLVKPDPNEQAEADVGVEMADMDVKSSAEVHVENEGAVDTQVEIQVEAEIPPMPNVDANASISVEGGATAE
jgi:hypothetical protein